jgi:hypothetical protein
LAFAALAYSMTQQSGRTPMTDRVGLRITKRIAVADTYPVGEAAAGCSRSQSHVRHS